MPRMSPEVANQIQQIFMDNCNIKTRSYSGKGMYGSNCLGIVGEVEDCQGAITEVVEQLFADAFDGYIDVESEEQIRNAGMLRRIANDSLATLIRYHHDSLGLQAVFYWPDIPYNDELDTEYFGESEE